MQSSESAALYVGIVCNTMQSAGVVYSVTHMDTGRRRLALQSLAGVSAALALLVLAFVIPAIRYDVRDPWVDHLVRDARSSAVG